MFLGHFAVGLAGRPLAPRVPLPVLLVAPQFLDVVWPVLVALGVERARIEPGHLAASPLVLEHMPYSHSLAAAVVWSLLAALGYVAWRKDGRGAILVGALVFSHWILDLVAHEPDLALWPGSARYGLGLWHSLPATLAVELVMFLTGAWLYVRATPAVAGGRHGRRLYGLLGLLTVLYVAATVGPPPPSLGAVLVSAGGMTLVLVPLAAWVERGHGA